MLRLLIWHIFCLRMEKLSEIKPTLTNFFHFLITGRIVNRFSSDLYTVDDSLPFILNIFLAQVVGVIGPIVVTTYAVPWIIIGT